MATLVTANKNPSYLMRSNQTYRENRNRHHRDNKRFGRPNPMKPWLCRLHVTIERNVYEQSHRATAETPLTIAKHDKKMMRRTGSPLEAEATGISRLDPQSKRGLVCTKLVSILLARVRLVN
jgi:plasmid replication initiation protein